MLLTKTVYCLRLYGNYLGLWSPSSKTGVETLSLEIGPNSLVSGSWKAKVIGLSFWVWPSAWSFGPVDDLQINKVVKKPDGQGCTVVGLSTRPVFLIVFNFFWIQNFKVLKQVYGYN